VRGTLGPGTLIALLRVLGAEQKSGILDLTHGSVARKLLFQGGSIKFASTTVTEERLGDFLARSGKIKLADLEKATRQVGRGERLGQILVRLGLLSQDELVRYAREHILQIIFACFGMEGGAFKFEEMEVPLGQEIKAGLSMGAIIMEAVRRMSPAEAGAGLGTGDILLRPSNDPRLRSQPISLRPQEGFILSRVDGRTRVDEIVTVSPLPAEETLRTLFGLWCAGLIEDPADPTHLPVARMTPQAGPGAASAPPAAPAHTAAPASTAAPAPPASRPAASPPRAVASPPGSASATAGTPPAAASRPPSAAPRREAVRGSAAAAPRAAAPSSQDRARQVIERLMAAENQTFYDLLGVLQSADENDIRHAYYGLAKRFHPDRFQGADMEHLRREAERLFSMLTEAYNVLSDPEARQRYDQERTTPEPQSAASRHEEQSSLARQNFLHGKALLEQGQLHHAVTFFENAIQQDGTKAEYFQYLASVQMKNPKWRQECEQNFQHALELDPSLVTCYISLGQIYRRSGRDEQAEQMFRQALQWDPDHPVARRELSSAPPAKATAGVSSMLKGLFKK
jgi:curved DNA-binding protein CbpA